jgi:hypothetical protein
VDTVSPAPSKALDKAGVKQKSVFLSWDFTVASDKSLTARLLALRDDAFAQLGDRNLADGVLEGAPPAYTITTVQDSTPGQDNRIMRRISGTFTVPCYLDQPDCPPGARMHYDPSNPDAIPTQLPGNVIQAPFHCNIPRVALGTPSHVALYGHGLLGSHAQIEEDNIKSMSQEHDFTLCATDWAGMASEDVPNAVEILQDFSKFPSLADRLQQGILDTLYLGGVLAHPQGIAANPAFSAGGRPLLDTSNLYFDSNSQGAILGGLATAVAPDWQHGVLGVATVDYATLPPRSTDFDTYNAVLAPAYPHEDQRMELLSVAQMLWDRGETTAGPRT